MTEGIIEASLLDPARPKTGNDRLIRLVGGSRCQRCVSERDCDPLSGPKMAQNIKAKMIEVDATHVAKLARPRETANLILEATA